MKKEDVKIGMKVVPFKKGLYGNLECSSAWKDAQMKRQSFLYVTGVSEAPDCFVLNDTESIKGDFFYAEDFEPYIEPKSTIKPPIGVTPIHMFEKQRSLDLARALYEHLSLPCNKDFEMLGKWAEELVDRIGNLRFMTEE